MEQTASWPGWETVRLIGRGSFGAVYEIQRSLFGEVEKAALKVITIPQNVSDIEELRNEGFDKESITDTFKNHLKSIVAEYSLMRKMNGSANIVNCDDVRYVQHEDGIGWDIYIKMELLTPLTKTLPDAIPEETVIKIALDLCSALELCKKHDIVHRDIKPQNIFVSDNGDYKLGDFGIAKTVEKTMSGTKIGTYKYMAPEVYNNQPYGSAADIYSLGLVLYWLLNERRMPFLPLPPAKLGVGMDEAARTRRLTGEPIPPPRHGSEELKRIVLKACAYEPKERYTDAHQMKAALNHLSVTSEEPAAKEVPVTPPDEGMEESDATIVPPVQKTTSNQEAKNAPHAAPKKRKGSLIAAVCVIVGLLVGGSVFFLDKGSRQTEMAAGPTIGATTEVTTEAMTEAPTEDETAAQAETEEVTKAPTEEATEETAKAAKIPVKVFNNSNATIEVFDYVEGDAASLETPAESVTVGNQLAVKVTPAEGYKIAHVRVNSKSVDDMLTEAGYWCVPATKGTKSYAVKVLMTKEEPVEVTKASTEEATEETAEAAKIPVKVFNNSNAVIEVFDYVEGDAASLETPVESVTVGNSLAIKVTAEEGYEIAHVRVNSKSVDDTLTEGGFWCVPATEGTNSYAVKVLLTKAEAVEEVTEAPAETEAVVEETAAPVPGVITKVALVTDVGTIDDESFNQACWQGVEAWCQANGIEYTYYQPTEDSTDARVLSVFQAVNEGANVIVMPGYLFGTTVLTVQDELPDVYFIAVDVSDGDLTFDYSTYYDPSANVACLTFSEEQAGYLAGYAAVKEGYTKLGFLGGMAVPAVIRYGYGFVQGADAAAAETGAEVEINYTYGGQFYGSPEITAKMEGWYQNGTEVVFACGGGIYTSALEAAEKNGGKVIGVDVDQSYISPLIITSAMKGLQNVTESLLESLNKGEWKTYGGKVTNLGLREGEYVGLSTSTWKMKNFSVSEYNAVKEKIKSGKIVVSNRTDAMPKHTITVLAFDCLIPVI